VEYAVLGIAERCDILSARSAYAMSMCRDRDTLFRLFGRGNVGLEDISVRTLSCREWLSRMEAVKDDDDSATIICTTIYKGAAEDSEAQVFSLRSYPLFYLF